MRRRRGLVVAVLVIAVLLATLLPPLVTLANALNDYRQLSQLGESGLRHLLAAKDDLSGLTALPGLDGVGGLLNPKAAAIPDASYNYLAQRQGGTVYPIGVAVHPAPGMASAGLKDAQFNATVAANTLFQYGVKPTPTPAPTATPTPTPTPSPTPSATPTGGKPGGGTPSLSAAVGELRGAQRDFGALRAKLNNPDWILDSAGTLPGTKTRLITIRALADVGYDVATIALDFATAFDPVLKRAEGGALAGQQDLVTPGDLAAIQRAFEHAGTLLDDVQARLPMVDIGQLPITPAQAATFNAAVEQLPGIREALRQATPWVQTAGWMLGVGQGRKFLVQTLDKAELRPSGGFTGNFGVLSLKNAKLDPFALKNINDIDYNGNGWIFGRHPPDQYAWWPFPDFGLRDSNLSADFPTTARTNIDVFKNEGGGDVDGVIQFTTTMVAHVLRVTGPIPVPQFNETVTADNLEERIHFWEEDPRGVAIQEQMFPDVPKFSRRKQFTFIVTQLLQEKVKHLPQNELMPLAKQVLDDMKSKELQVYVTNPQIEDLLLKLGAAGAVDTRAGIDGYLMVQANVTVSKGTPYVAIAQNDDVRLDDKGGATHQLTITLTNRPDGPLYGYSTYRDYVRIYVPPQARLIRATGFDSGRPLCWAPPPWNPGEGVPARFAGTPLCTGNPYPDGELRCPSGGYGPGGIAYTYFSDGRTDWALDTLGAPPAATSDLPGRAMWGGNVVVPASCTATLKLKWYVPNVAHA